LIGRLEGVIRNQENASPVFLHYEKEGAHSTREDFKRAFIELRTHRIILTMTFPKQQSIKEFSWPEMTKVQAGKER
jgi:hypothetical protein